MYIKQIEHTHKNYETLVLKYGRFFNVPSWIKIYKTNLLLNGLFNDNNELIGAFNLYKQFFFGIKIYKIPPFSPHNALFFINPALSNSNKITFEKDVHQLICEYIKKLNSHLTLTAFPPEIIDAQVYIWNKFKVIPNYTYQLNLESSTDELFNNLTTEKRKSIRKADKDLVIVKQVHDYTIIKQLILKTFERKNKSINNELIDRILFKFANSSNSFAFVSYYNNIPSACTFSVFYNQTSYYLFGGYDKENKHHGSGASAMWQSILYAKSINIKTFDFEGSMLPEVEKYFREFGGNLVPYYTVNKAFLPFELLLKFKKRELF